MKKGFKAAVLAVLVVSALTCAALSAAGERRATDTVPASVGTETPAFYTLRTYGGGVAVFSGYMETPIAETDIELSTLREADRDMLDRGITVYSREELLGLLEDFSG